MHIQDFKNSLSLKGLSENTVNNYANRIEIMLRELTIENFSQSSINAYLLKVKGEYAISTLNLTIIALKAFLSYLKREDIELPALFTITKTLPESFTEEYFETEIIRVVESCCKEPIKIKALFYFLFYTGIRVGEIDTLKRADFDLVQRKAKIYCPKTQEERMIFYTNKVRDMLRYYFDSEAEVTNAFNMSANSVKAMFYNLKSYFRDISFHPHAMRHSFAVNCLIKGVDLYTVSKLLGHKNIETTMRYVGLTSTQMQDIYEEKINKRKRKR